MLTTHLIGDFVTQIFPHPPSAVTDPLAGRQRHEDEVRRPRVAHVDGHRARLVAAPAAAHLVAVDLQAAVLDLGQGGVGVRARLL